MTMVKKVTIVTMASIATTVTTATTATMVTYARLPQLHGKFKLPGTVIRTANIFFLLNEQMSFF